MSEPTTSLVALRDRRAATIQRLSDAYAEDLLELAAFEDRLARAHGATDLATLDALVADLQPTQSTALAPLVQSGTPAPPRKKVLAVFSSVERRGTWAVPTSMRASAVFGSTVLDFREAAFQPGTTELEVRAVFGNVEIVVPPHLAVECDGNAIFANFEQRHGGAIDDPTMPRLRVVGSAVFGNVEVRLRLPHDDLHHRLAGRDRLRALPPRRDDG
jgi:hypothetical protein